MGTLCAQLLLQFYANLFQTLQVFLSWSEDMHVVWKYSSDHFFSLLIVHISFTHYKAGDINSLNFSPCFFFQVFIFASSQSSCSNTRLQTSVQISSEGGGYRCQCSGTCLIASFVFYVIVLIMTGKCL